MFGLLCTDDLNIVGHSMFMNYRMALYNYLGIKNFKEIRCVNDLEGITHLFIIDEHFRYNLEIWGNDEFIKEININSIKTIIFNSEKIYIDAFPWNAQIQERVKSIKNYIQFVCDIDEAKFFGSKVINKFFISRGVKFNIDSSVEKINKILFVGQIDGNQYSGRRELIQKIKLMGLPIDIYNSQRKMQYSEILNMYNKYKYILCPIGTGKWFSYRHYEVTHLGSIPIQQVTDDMIEWFSELQYSSIFFNNIKDIEKKIDNFTTTNKEIMLEDYFETIKLCEYL